MIKNKMVKLKPDTVEVLKNLKIAERESYDEVINRLLIQKLTEDELELNTRSKEIIIDRIKNFKQGKVKSFAQILDSFNRKNEVADGKKEWEKEKRSLGGEENVTMED